MGKIKKNRQKFNESKVTNEKTSNIEDNSVWQFLPPRENLFSDVNATTDNFKQLLSDDTKSVASFKSSKSELGTRIKKKDKLKLRHEILLRKIDKVNQFKRKQKQRKERKNIAIIGDTNALRDALPSLDSLLKSRDLKSKVAILNNPKKAIVKANQREKNIVQGVGIYKKLINNKQFKKNPLQVICEHVRQRVESGDLK